MADEYTGYLRLDAGGVDKGVDQATNALNRLTDITRSSYYGLRNLAVGFEAVGAAAMAGLGIAAKAAMDWEASMAQIQAQTYDNTQSAQANAVAMGQVSDGLKNVAANTPVAISSLNSVAQQIGAAGFRGKELVSVTQTIIDLNKVTGASFDLLVPSVTKTAQSMGLGADGAKRMASALYETTRQSAATVGDVVQLNMRLQGFRALTGMSEAGVIAFANALGLVPQQARIAVGGFQKLGSVIEDAVKTGNDNLTELANVGGYQNAQAFSKAWATDPARALTTVIQSIGHLQNAQGTGGIEIEKLGLKEARQVQSLLAVAVAQDNVRGSQNDLINMINTANGAWQSGNAVQDAVHRIYQTTAAQLKILDNNVHLVGVSFGSVLLPVLNPVIQLFTNMAIGLASLPTGLKIAVAIFAGLAAVIGVVGGAMLLLLPKILLARQSLLQMAAAQQAAAIAAAEADAAMAAEAPMLEGVMAMATEAAAAMGLDAAQTQIYVVAALEAAVASGSLSAEAAAAAIAEMTQAEATGVLSAAMGLLRTAILPLLPMMLGLGLLVASVGTLLSILGDNHRKAAAAADENKQANQGLLAALEQEKNGVKDATDQWIIHELVTRGTLARLVGDYHISAQAIIDYIKGISNQNPADWMKDFHGSNKKPMQDLIDLRDSYHATVLVEGTMNVANAQLKDSTDEVTSAITDENGKILTVTELLKREYNAAVALISAKEQQKQSEFSLTDAKLRLADAKQKLIDKALYEQQAEDRVTAARDAHSAAIDQLAKDEIDLGTIRDREAEKLSAAQRQLASDQLRVQQAALNLQKAQKAVNDDFSPDKPNKYREALNAVHDAEANLWHASENLSDAQWYLNYLIGEGASKRDIADAQQAIVDATNKQADATDAVANAQNKLNDVPSQILADQLALQQAYLDQANAIQAVKDQEAAVQKLQLEVGNDFAYNEMLRKIDADHAAINQSILDEHTALDDLHKIQNGSIEREYSTAQQGVESAAIAVANANREVAIQTGIMHGHFLDAKGSAQLLHDQLIAMAKDIGGPIGTQLLQLAGLLNAVAGSAGDAANNFIVLYAAASAAQANIPFDDFLKNFNVGGGVRVLGSGGLALRPELAVIGDSPEVIIPLNDAARARQLVQQSGLMDLVGTRANTTFGSTAATSIAAGATHHTVNEGDSIQIVAQTNASAGDIADEFMWTKMRARS